MSNINKLITDAIIASLEQGRIPWKQPFPHGRPLRHNGTPYRGFNFLYLNHVARTEKYTSPYWMTLAQGNKYGGRIRPGQKSSLSIFYRKTATNAPADKADNAEEQEEETDGMQPTSFRPMFLLRMSRVFNASQFIDLPQRFYPPLVGAMELLAHDKAKAIVAGYPHPPTITESMCNPCYSPSDDEVFIPPMSCATSPESYYATLFHELIHSTGHESRINRPLQNHFGTAEYAKEELIAEIGSAFLCAEAEIQCDALLENTQAYIQSWISVLKKDARLIVSASARAESAVGHILDRVVTTQFTESPTPQPATA